MSTNETQQARVHAYAAEIMRIVSGIPTEEAATTLTLCVAALMICWTKDKKGRDEMAAMFTKQLRDMLNRDDIVEWIKAHTTYVEPMPMQ